VNICDQVRSSHPGKLVFYELGIRNYDVRCVQINLFWARWPCPFSTI